MAESRKSLALIIAVLLIMGSSFFINEARPLNSAKLGSVENIAIKNVFDGLSIEAIKNSGPSSGGHGHKANISETMEEKKTGGAITDGFLEENKRSVPSPGQGHKMEEDKTGGAITDGMLEKNKTSVPSPGQGH